MWIQGSPPSSQTSSSSLVDGMPSWVVHTAGPQNPCSIPYTNQRSKSMSIMSSSHLHAGIINQLPYLLLAAGTAGGELLTPFEVALSGPFKDSVGRVELSEQ